jgi:UDP-N-acetylmuramyl pentapeptide synthase
MKVREIVGAAGGKLVSGAQDLDVAPSRFSTDSRTIKKGDLFVAIEGPNFDGNDFLDDAFRKGAIGAIVSRSARTLFVGTRGRAEKSAPTMNAGSSSESKTPRGPTAR